MHTAKDYANAEEELEKLERERFDLALRISTAYRRLRAMRKRGIAANLTAPVKNTVLIDDWKYKNIEQMTPEERVKFDAWVASCAAGKNNP